MREIHVVQGAVHTQRVASGGALAQEGGGRVGLATESDPGGASGDHEGRPYGASFGAEYVLCRAFLDTGFRRYDGGGRGGDTGALK